VAFPSISTGVYGYPMELAAEVAVTAVCESLRELASLHEVIFCCFSPADLLVYQKLLAEAAR
jgi:O-acetyl-ADP-ribose deacetylase (regulator of RNase III)